MKKAFIGKGISGRYVCFTRWSMNGNLAEVHSNANKYDVDDEVKKCILDWIGERIRKIHESGSVDNDEFGRLIGDDFNKLADDLDSQKGDKE